MNILLDFDDKQKTSKMKHPELIRFFLTKTPYRAKISMKK